MISRRLESIGSKRDTKKVEITNALASRNHTTALKSPKIAVVQVVLFISVTDTIHYNLSQLAQKLHSKK